MKYCILIIFLSFVVDMTEGVKFETNHGETPEESYWRQVTLFQQVNLDKCKPNIGALQSELSNHNFLSDNEFEDHLNVFVACYTLHAFALESYSSQTTNSPTPLVTPVSYENIKKLSGLSRELFIIVMHDLVNSDLLDLMVKHPIYAPLQGRDNREYTFSESGKFVMELLLKHK